MQRVRKNHKLPIIFAVTVFIMFTVLIIGLSFNNGNSALAFTQEEYEDMISFVVDPGTYINGNIANATNIPKIKLELTGQTKLQPGTITTFWYYAKDKLGKPDATDNWSLIGTGQDAIIQESGRAYAEFTITSLAPGEYYSKYIYFMARLETVEEGDNPKTIYIRNINDFVLDLRIHNINDQGSTNVNIASITGTYINKLNQTVEYDLNKNGWVSSSITFTIRGINATIPTNYFFAFEDDNVPEDEKWKPCGEPIKAENGEYYSILKIEETYKGGVLFASMSTDGKMLTADGETYRRAIMLDIDIPKFSVDALKDIEGVSDDLKKYSGGYSAYDVIYTISPIVNNIISESRMGSPATYYYHDGQYNESNNTRKWIPMENINGIYRLTISKTTTILCFKGESAAGKDSSIEDPEGVVYYETLIDKVAPKITLTASDIKGITVNPLGTPEGTAGKIGFATDSIKFTARNTAQNLSTVYFDYDILTGAPENYRDRRASVPYEVVISESYVQTTFRFRATSEAGLVDVVSFTVSILKSDYVFEFEEDILLETKNGWAKDEIPVYFKLSNVMDIDGEYRFYSQISGGTSSERLLSSERVRTYDEDGIGYSVYKIMIDTLLNNQYLDFYAYNLAGDRSKTTLKTPMPIKLDFITPVANVTKRIVNSTIVLTENDWANGNVNIIIKSIVDNISGISCYPIIGASIGSNGIATGGQRGVPISINSLDEFIYEASSTNKFVFELVSGADRVQRFIVEVSIDLSDIVFSGIETYYLNQNGKEEKPAMDVNNQYYDITQTISSDLTVLFGTNHAGHFTFYYQQYFGESPIPSNYTWVTDQSSFVVPIANLEAVENGTLKYAFYLESRAISSNGSKKTTRIIYLTIKYDTRNFNIKVTYEGSGSSTVNFRGGEGIKFTISNLEPTVNIKEYQYSLTPVGSSTVGKWQTIADIDGNPITSTSGGQAYIEFLFKGVENIDPLTKEVLGLAFNGKIGFRAINTAGRLSQTIDEIEIKVDTSTPNPFNAISKTEGAETRTDSTGYIIIYSKDIVRYIDTLSRTPYDQYAPIEYYYMKQSAWGQSGYPSGDNFNLQLSGGVLEFETEPYFIFAKNSVGSRSNVYLIQTQVETITPRATLSVSNEAAVGISGLYEFNWKHTAAITISVVSNTQVYYEYKIGEKGAWTRYNDNSLEGSLTLYFIGEEREGFENAVVKNFDDIVYFRVINLAGSYCDFTGQHDKVRIRMDVRTPYFDIKTTVQGEELLDRSKWQSSEVFLRLYPVNYVNGQYVPFADPSAANPGGVTYTYSFSDMDDVGENLPGDGTFFSTDELANSLSDTSGFNGNGIVTVYIKATAKASQKTHKVSITLYIDKVAPDFDLRGQITRGTNTEYIDSGTWTNADEVRLNRIPKVNSKSNVEYTYYTSTYDQPSPWNTTNPLPFITMCVVYVTAKNGSGLTVTKEFDVKIDQSAPVIFSGIITNAKRVDPNTNEEVIDRQNPNTYYIDQIITYEEANLKSAFYNNFPLANGAVIGTNTVDNSNTGGLGTKGGYVHIVVEDMAGNKAELIFFMTVFELDVNTMTLAPSHREMLDIYEEQFQYGQNGMSTDRRAHFQMQIRMLRDREATLERQVVNAQAYLERINETTLFTLNVDYPEMKEYIDKFISEDWTILYPAWQQDMIKEGIYGQYYQKLEATFRDLNQLMAIVLNVQKKVSILPALNVVKRNDYVDILNVYNSYMDLSSAQKNVFNSQLYNKLIELKRTCEVLRLQDEETGISIMGDDLAPGVEIVVRDFEKTTDYFYNTQISLWETMPQNTPRTILYMKQLLLSDFGSQYETGLVTITLPIPEDYRNYKYFSVFRVTTNGSLVQINNVTIDAYGASVYFNSNTLDTYVLAVNAEMTIDDNPKKIYATFGDIEIDAALLTYITVATSALFVLILIILIIVVLRHKGFLKRFNKGYKNSLKSRGIESIPKGNAKARTNPASFKDKMKY